MDLEQVPEVIVVPEVAQEAPVPEVAEMPEVTSKVPQTPEVTKLVLNRGLKSVKRGL
jgi:hypothetical protein